MSQTVEQRVTIRAASIEDAPIILEITRAAFEQFRGRLDPPSGVFHETLDTLLESTFQPNHGATLALIDDSPAGTLRWSVAPQRQHLYVGRVAVLPAYRRQGVASALMNWADAHARALGLPAVQFGVRLQAPENIRFYQHLGYEIVSQEHHEGYDHPTFVWMRKPL